MLRSGIRIPAVLLIVAATVSCFNACRKETGADDPGAGKPKAANPVVSLGAFNGFDIVAQNTETALLLDRESASISLQNKKTGTILPTTGAGNDLSGVSLEETKSQVNSQIILEFYDNRDKQFIYNSYDYCVKDDQVEYSGIKNGVRLTYTVGKPDSRTTLPEVLTAETMNKVVLPNIDDEQREMIDRFYTLLEPDELGDTKDTMTEAYPILKEKPVYAAKQIGLRFKLRLTEIFAQAGLTVEAIEKEYKKIGYKTTYEVQPCFVVPVDYTLEDGAFRVAVDCSQIVYNRSLYNLTTLKILPYFGSMNRTKDGYLFMPDGSGILINGDSKNPIGVSLSLFGDDVNNNIMEADEEILDKNSIMPVFGIKNRSEALFAVIEDGAGIASLTAGTAQDATTLSHIIPSFELLHREAADSKGMVIGTRIVRYSKKAYDGKISVNYYLLSGEKADYAGMAEKYREILFAGRKLQEQKTPFYLTSIGAVNRNERFFGMPVTRERALTDTDQAKRILQAFLDRGIGDIVFCYHNWICDEYDSKVPGRAVPSKAIGGAKGIKDLCGFTKQNGIRFYPNLQLTYAARNSLLGGFNGWGDSAKSLDSVDTGETGFYLSPKNILLAAQKLKAGLGDYDFGGISADTLGSDLFSDFTEKDVILREEAVSCYRKTAELLSGEFSLMTDVGNAYMIPYVTDITNLPLTGSHYSAEYKSVPFAPMVLHGYVHYAGEPLNLQTGKRREFLKSVEYGAGLLFSLNFAKAEMLKQTCYTDLFSTDYTAWQETAASYYREAAGAYAATAGARMVQNTEIGDNVFKTVYDNGVSIYVNYNPEDQNAESRLIPKESFVVAGK